MRPVALATLLLALAASTAWADEDEDKQQAVQLMTEGDAKFAKGDAAAALAKYHEAYDAFPSPKLYFVMARAEEALGKLADGLAHYEQFLAEVPNVKKALRKEVDKSIAKLKTKVGMVSFQLDVEGAVITVDGKPVGEAPIEKPIYVDPGPHVFGAQADGMAAARIEQSVGPGERATILLELKELPKRPPKKVAEPEPEPEPEPVAGPVVRRSSKTGFYVGLALTSAFLVTGTVTGIMAVSDHGDFSDESLALDDRKAAKDSGETLAVVTDVMLVCGLAAGAYTTWYYFAKMRRGRESRAAGASSGRGMPRPAVSARGAGAVLGFDF